MKVNQESNALPIDLGASGFSGYLSSTANFLRSMAAVAFTCAALTPCGTALARDAYFVWLPNSEPDLAGYRLYQWKGDDSPEMVATFAKDAVRGGATGLLPGYTYTWHLTAFNTAGLESDPSDTVTWTVPIAAPRGFRSLSFNPEFSEEDLAALESSQLGGFGLQIGRGYSEAGHVALPDLPEYRYNIQYDLGGKSPLDNLIDWPVVLPNH